MSKNKKKKSGAKRKAPENQQKKPEAKQKALRVRQEESEGKQKSSNTLKRPLKFLGIIIGIFTLAVVIYFGLNTSCQNHRDVVSKRVEAVGIDVGIVNDNILVKQKGNESVDDLLVLYQELKDRYGAANTAIAKGDFAEAENEANECVRILDLIQPHAVSTDRKDITVTAGGGFLSFNVDIGNATGLTQDGKPLTGISLAMGGLPAPLATNQQFVVSYFMSPDGASFDKPVNITFYYGSERVPEGFPEERLILLTWDSENRNLITIPNTKVNLETHSITMSVSRLTEHYIIVAPSP